jgi:hypothetical protein
MTYLPFLDVNRSTARLDDLVEHSLRLGESTLMRSCNMLVRGWVRVSLCTSSSNPLLHATLPYGVYATDR